MRTNKDLKHLLEDLLSGPFKDMPIQNSLTIEFSKRARRRFGSIRMRRDQKVSEIRINGVFRKEEIPVEIIQATIAHELCHYAHGFSSPLPQLYKHPHQGGVIAKELKKRGLDELHQFEKKWVKNIWPKVLTSEFPAPVKRKRSTLRRVGSRRRVLYKRRSLADQLIKEILDLF